jgi:hypothetical protein
VVSMFASSVVSGLGCVVMDRDRRLPPPVLVISDMADAAHA